MTTFRRSVGVALERLRTSLGLTKTEVAQRTQRIRAEHISRYELEAKLQLSTLGELLDALGANLCDVVREMEATGEVAPRTVLSPSSSLLGDAQAVSLAVHYLRTKRGRTTDEVSRHMGVSETAVKSYESGRPMRLSTLERILEALGATLLDFHEALVLAHSVLAWQAEAADDTPHLRYCLQRLGQPHLDAASEQALLLHLRQMRRQLDAAPGGEAG